MPEKYNPTRNVVSLEDFIIERGLIEALETDMGTLSDYAGRAWSAAYHFGIEESKVLGIEGRSAWRTAKEWDAFLASVDNPDSARLIRMAVQQIAGGARAIRRPIAHIIARAAIVYADSK